MAQEIGFAKLTSSSSLSMADREILRRIFFLPNDASLFSSFNPDYQLENIKQIISFLQDNKGISEKEKQAISDRVNPLLNNVRTASAIGLDLFRQQEQEQQQQKLQQVEKEKQIIVENWHAPADIILWLKKDLGKPQQCYCLVPASAALAKTAVSRGFTSCFSPRVFISDNAINALNGDTFLSQHLDLYQVYLVL